VIVRVHNYDGRWLAVLTDARGRHLARWFYDRPSESDVRAVWRSSPGEFFPYRY